MLSTKVPNPKKTLTFASFGKSPLKDFTVDSCDLRIDPFIVSDSDQDALTDGNSNRLLCVQITS